VIKKVFFKGTKGPLLDVQFVLKSFCAQKTHTFIPWIKLNLHFHRCRETVDFIMQESLKEEKNYLLYIIMIYYLMFIPGSDRTWWVIVFNLNYNGMGFLLKSFVFQSITNFHEKYLLDVFNFNYKCSFFLKSFAFHPIDNFLVKKISKISCWSFILFDIW